MPLLALSYYLLFGLNLGVGKAFPWAFLPAHLGGVIWWAASVGLVVLLFWVRLGASFEGFCQRLVSFRAWPMVLVGGNALFCVLNFEHFKHLGYAFPWFQLVGCALVLPWVRNDRLWLSALFSCFLLAASIATFPLDERRSDMLPVIQAGWAAWRNGVSPYAPLVLDGHTDWMPYLPGVFLSHAGAVLLGLDLRWNELVFRALWMGWLALRASRLPDESPWKGAVGFLLLSPYLGFRHDLYFEIFCLMLCAYAFLPRCRTALIPVLIITRQWAWVLAPFLLLDRCRREGWVRSVGVFALSSAVIGGGLVALLRSTTSMPQFLAAVLAFQDRLAWESYPGDFGLSFAPALYALGVARWAQWMQAGVVAACGILALIRMQVGSRGSLELRWGIIAWVGFLLLNHHFWIYFWLSPIVWIVAEGVAREPDAEPRARSPLSGELGVGSPTTPA